MLISQRWDSFF